MNLTRFTNLIAADSTTVAERFMSWLRMIYTESSFFSWIYWVLGALLLFFIARLFWKKANLSSITKSASSIKDKAASTASSATSSLSETASSVTDSASDAVSSVAASAASSVSSTADSLHQTAKDAEKLTPSIVSKSTGSTSWKDRILFGKTRQRLIDQENPVPELLPEDAPNINGKDQTFGAATPVLAAMLPQSEESRFTHKKDLQKAGYYKPRAWQNLAAIRYAAIIIPLFLFGLLFLFLPAQYEWIAAILLIIVPVAGWALPSLFIKSKAADRLSEIENGMPDMLDMMNMCVGQGLTVKESLKRVSTDIQPVYPALAQELSIVHQQAEVGTLRHALENFSDRIDTPPVKSFTSLLIQTDEMGTSVSDALEDHSDSMRETLRQRADEKANSSAFKLLFPTVLCLMPAVYMILLGPAIIEISNFLNDGSLDLIRNGQTIVDQMEIR